MADFDNGHALVNFHHEQVQHSHPLQKDEMEHLSTGNFYTILCSKKRVTERT